MTTNNNRKRKTRRARRSEDDNFILPWEAEDAEATKATNDIIKGWEAEYKDFNDALKAEYEKDMAGCNDIIKAWDAEVAEAAAALAADDIDGGTRGGPKRSK